MIDSPISDTHQSSAMLSCLSFSICIHAHVWKGTGRRLCKDF